MHSLIHIEYAKAQSQARSGERPTATAHERPHGPPGAARGAIAKVLVAAASRLDREAVRRAVA